MSREQKRNKKETNHGVQQGGAAGGGPARGDPPAAATVRGEGGWHPLKGGAACLAVQDVRRLLQHAHVSGEHPSVREVVCGVKGS